MNVGREYEVLLFSQNIKSLDAYSMVTQRSDLAKNQGLEGYPFEAEEVYVETGGETLKV